MRLSFTSLRCVAVATILSSLFSGFPTQLNAAPHLPTSFREPVRARHAMVASTKRAASTIGVDVMKRGGNAIDAAIAVAFALAVAHPVAGNIGGGGFMLIRLSNGRTTAIDYREVAPRSASRDMYIGADGAVKKGEGSSTVGYRSVGVPGTVAGLELALKKYGSGRLSWAQLIEPARRLARDGFRLDNAQAYSFRHSEKLPPNSDSSRIFLNNGAYFDEGDLLRQLELAETLTRLQRNGAREFYQGRTARMIADDMKRHNGLVTLADLKSYKAKERVPVRGTYRGNEIISMPPPSSGGVVLIQMLNILEGFDLNRMGWNSSDSIHVLTETMRRSFADRSEYMGDTDFVDVPVAGLIDKTYATRLRSTIDLRRASKSEDVRPGHPAAAEPSETTHFTVVDKDGNVVANTYTLNGDYGSGAVARGTGILLNNEMDDFTSKPGVPNDYGLIQGERNSIQPGKRPLSAMSPTVLLRPDGSFWFAVGSPGGPRIISAVLQTIVNVVDFEMNIQQAIDSPRIHHQWLPDELVFEPFGLSADTVSSLESRGHKLKLRTEYQGYTINGFMGDVEGVMIEQKSGMRLGATDPRRSDGAAVGY